MQNKMSNGISSAVVCQQMHHRRSYCSRWNIEQSTSITTWLLLLLLLLVMMMMMMMIIIIITAWSLTHIDHVHFAFKHVCECTEVTPNCISVQWKLTLHLKLVKLLFCKCIYVFIQNNSFLLDQIYVFTEIARMNVSTANSACRSKCLMSFWVTLCSNCTYWAAVKTADIN